MDRRSLFRFAAASGLLGIFATSACRATEAGRTAAQVVTEPEGPMPPLPQLRDYSEFRGELRGEILYRKLGWTEESVSAIGFGGSHFSEPGIDQATSVVITGVANRRDLDQAFEATRTFQPMNKEQVAELLARSRPYALEGKYELFKTGAVLDGTAKTTE